MTEISSRPPDTAAKLWPPDYVAEIARREELAKYLLADEEALKIAQQSYSVLPSLWINDWCVTYDPRAKVKIMPFMLFERQEDLVQFLLECYLEKESGLIEKCRDMGATWVCAAFSVWLFLYHPAVSVGWGSRLSDLVDELGNPDSIFEKMRIILDNLPPFMLPPGFALKTDAPYMKILNRQTGANIAGETGDNIGRGGRSSIYFKDESAHYERPEKIEAALGDNTDVQIDISSVNGTANVFYRRRMAGEVWERGKKFARGVVRVFIMDWRDHPAKTQEWYDARRAKAEREGLLHTFAQEVDRDYSGAVQGVIIPSAWVKSAIDAHIKLNIPIEGEKTAAQDVADGGADKNALVARHGILCNFADHWAGEAGAAAEIAVPHCVDLKVSELYYDSIGIGVGFKTQINTMKEKPSWPQSLRVFPWNAGAKVLDPEDNSIPGDPESPLNKDQYANLKAQSWFRVRARFYKTHRAVTEGEKFDPGELISICSKIPKLHQLTNELSQPVRKKNGEGKTVVEKTPTGASSPNLADAFVACYSPTREISILDVI